MKLFSVNEICSTVIYPMVTTQRACYRSQHEDREGKDNTRESFQDKVLKREEIFTKNSKNLLDNGISFLQPFCIFIL